MRDPGKAIDPRAMLFDLSSDPITYGVQRCDLVRAELQRVLAETAEPGRSWQEVGQAYLTLQRETSSALNAIARYVGGVQVERVLQGQAPGVRPFQPVAAEAQRRALDALARHAFAPDALAAPAELYAHLQQQRRGFDHGDGTEDIFRNNPQVMLCSTFQHPFYPYKGAGTGNDRMINVPLVFRTQTGLLNHLLHPQTLQRIQDSGLYGNTVGLDEVFERLTTAIFTGDDPAKPMSTMRQNLQLEFLARLLNLAHSSAHYPATQSSALLQIERIRALEFPGTPAHQLAVRYRIRRALDDK